MIRYVSEQKYRSDNELGFKSKPISKNLSRNPLGALDTNSSSKIHEDKIIKIDSCDFSKIEKVCHHSHLMQRHTSVDKKYVVTFPPGAMGLELEPVIISSEKKIGCRVKEFYFPVDHVGIDPTEIKDCVQKGDIITSIEDDCVLSAEFDIILKRLRELATKIRRVTFKNMSLTKDVGIENTHADLQLNKLTGKLLGSSRSSNLSRAPKSQDKYNRTVTTAHFDIYSETASSSPTATSHESAGRDQDESVYLSKMSSPVTAVTMVRSPLSPHAPPRSLQQAPHQRADEGGYRGGDLRDPCGAPEEQLLTTRILSAQTRGSSVGHPGSLPSPTAAPTSSLASPEPHIRIDTLPTSTSALSRTPLQSSQVGGKSGSSGRKRRPRTPEEKILGIFRDADCSEPPPPSPNKDDDDKGALVDSNAACWARRLAVPGALVEAESPTLLDSRLLGIVGAHIGEGVMVAGSALTAETSKLLVAAIHTPTAQFASEAIGRVGDSVISSTSRALDEAVAAVPYFSTKEVQRLSSSRDALLAELARTRWELGDAEDRFKGLVAVEAELRTKLSQREAVVVLLEQECGRWRGESAGLVRRLAETEDRLKCSSEQTGMAAADQEERRRSHQTLKEEFRVCKARLREEERSAEGLRRGLGEEQRAHLLCQQRLTEAWVELSVLRESHSQAVSEHRMGLERLLREKLEVEAQLRVTSEQRDALARGSELLANDLRSASGREAGLEILVSGLKSDLAASADELSRCKNMAEDIAREKNQEIRQLKAELDSKLALQAHLTHTQMEEAEARQRDLAKDLEKVNKELELSRYQLSQSQNQITHCREELSSQAAIHSAQVMELQRSISSGRESCEDWERKFNSLQQEFEEEVAKSLAVQASLQCQLRDCQSKIIQDQGSCEELKLQLRKAQDEIQAKTEERRLLEASARDKLSALQVRCAGLVTEVDELRDRLTAQRCERDEEAKRAQDEHHCEIAWLYSQLSQLRDTGQAEARELSALLQQQRDHQLELEDKLRSALEQGRSSASRELERERESLQLRRVFEMYRNKVKSMLLMFRHELESMRNQLRLYEEHNGMSQNSLSAVCSKYKGFCDAASNAVAIANAEKESAMLKLHAAVTQQSLAEDLAAEIERKRQAEATERRNDAVAMAAKLHELQSANKILSKSLSEKRSELRSWDQRGKEMGNKIDLLTEEVRSLQERDANCANLKKDNESLMGIRIELSEQLRTAKDKCAHFQSKYELSQESFTATVGSLNSEINSLNLKLRALEDDLKALKQGSDRQSVASSEIQGPPRSELLVTIASQRRALQQAEEYFADCHESRAKLEALLANTKMDVTIYEKRVRELETELKLHTSDRRLNRADRAESEAEERDAIVALTNLLREKERELREVHSIIANMTTSPFKEKDRHLNSSLSAGPGCSEISQVFDNSDQEGSSDAATTHKGRSSPTHVIPNGSYPQASQVPVGWRAVIRLQRLVIRRKQRRILQLEAIEKEVPDVKKQLMNLNRTFRTLNDRNISRLIRSAEHTRRLRILARCFARLCVEARVKFKKKQINL